ncbi:MAG: PDZ domain-containing protein [Pyrinomonadaceae bacterium]
MFKPTLVLVLLTAFLFAMNQETPAQKKPAAKPTPVVKSVPPEVSYTVSMSKPWTHLLEVEMNVKWEQMPDRTELKMPVWTPGSYLIREYARHVQNFSVKGASGDLTWAKTNKNTWAVETKGAKEFTAKYFVYCNELTVRTNEVNDEHAFWNNGAALFWVKDHLSIPSTVKVNPYGNWKVATGLPAVDGQANTFRAENYDVLYDSPFEVSDFQEFKFDIHGKQHRFIMSGEGNYDLKKLAADTTKIVDEAYKIFGEFAYNDYTFIVNLRGGGGLEHLNSTALQTNRFGFRPDARYKGFLGLVAHEYFHNFNVKRIRPDALGPFDYENENYTKLLWVAEGGTEYYSNLLLVRAGLITDKQYLRDRASGIQALQNRPGRLETSLESASFDAWIKYYRPDENAVNNQISYYDKGEIVNMMLDMAIRSATGGAKSLDDVMRTLYTDFFKKGKNYSPADFQKVSETVAGKSLDDFFAKYVRGVAEIDYNAFANPFGVNLNMKTPNASKAYIGADTTEANGVLSIRSLSAGTPAYEQGLNTGDQIVAIDGYRASSQFMTSYLNEKKPNDKIKLTIFRFDKLRDVDFVLGGDKRQEYDFSVVSGATEEQKKLYKQYLNGDL